ncbi:hypothetical protein NJ7G_4229 [Natrinema sp. J7-2]|nr:hypothetical protein NJ7G_4229 [Natrinema sp. J7-2]
MDRNGRLEPGPSAASAQSESACIPPTRVGTHLPLGDRHGSASPLSIGSDGPEPRWDESSRTGGKGRGTTAGRAPWLSAVSPAVPRLFHGITHRSIPENI